MARKKHTKITWQNIYNRLSRGGKRYFDITSFKNISRLSRKQRLYLNAASISGYVIPTREEYMSMTRDAQKEYLKSLGEILRGERFNSRIGGTIQQYQRALAQNGLTGLADAIGNITKNMNPDSKYVFLSQFPPVEDVYPPRSRHGRKKNAEPQTLDPESKRGLAIKKIINTMRRYGWELDEQTGEFVDTFDIKLDEDNK